MNLNIVLSYQSVKLPLDIINIITYYYTEPELKYEVIYPMNCHTFPIFYLDLKFTILDNFKMCTYTIKACTDNTQLNICDNGIKIIEKYIEIYKFIYKHFGDNRVYHNTVAVVVLRSDVQKTGIYEVVIQYMNNKMYIGWNDGSIEFVPTKKIIKQFISIFEHIMQTCRNYLNCFDICIKFSKKD